MRPGVSNLSGGRVDSNHAVKMFSKANSSLSVSSGAVQGKLPPRAQPGDERKQSGGIVRAKFGIEFGLLIEVAHTDFYNLEELKPTQFAISWQSFAHFPK
jgi:hypothetical protein